jgi:hypothetical protein
MAVFLSSFFLGLQKVSLSAVGAGHVPVTLRYFEIGGGSCHALRLVGLLTEELGSLTIIDPRQKAPSGTANGDWLSSLVSTPTPSRS